jgi:hypothetical protein
MPSPIIWLHVAKCGVDTTLSGNCVTSGGEQFCDDGGFEAFLNFENKREYLSYCLFFST